MMFGMKKQMCGLCGGKVHDGSGIMQYKATDESGERQLFSMSICKDCCDDMDKDRQDAGIDDVRDSLLRKL